MIFAITGVHGGHAFPIHGAHSALDASGHYQAGTNQQGAKSQGRVSHEFLVHACFLRHHYVVRISPYPSGG